MNVQRKCILLNSLDKMTFTVRSVYFNGLIMVVNTIACWIQIFNITQGVACKLYHCVWGVVCVCRLSAFLVLLYMQYLHSIYLIYLMNDLMSKYMIILKSNSKINHFLWVPIRIIFQNVQHFIGHLMFLASLSSFQDFTVSTVPVCGGTRLKDICSMGGPDTIIISNSDGAKKTLRVSECVSERKMVN